VALKAFSPARTSRQAILRFPLEARATPRSKTRNGGAPDVGPRAVPSIRNGRVLGTTQRPSR